MGKCILLLITRNVQKGHNTSVNLTQVFSELCQEMSPSLTKVLLVEHSHTDFLVALKTMNCCLLCSEFG